MKSPRIGLVLGSRRFLLAILLLTACDVQQNDEADGSQSGTPTDSLRVALLVPDEARAGTDVPIEVHVQNTSERKLELNLQGREIVFDLTVSQVDGTVVWRRLEGVATQAILRLEPLAPKEVLTLRGVWPKEANQVAAGEYEVFASIPTDTLALQSPAVRFRVTN